MLTGRWRWLAYLLAPVALICGVAVQRYYVEVHDQSAWAGGGFGMFSTVDISDGRARRAYVLTDQGPALVMDIEAIPRAVYTRPRAEAVAEVAEGLAARGWVVYGPESYRALWQVLPDLLKTHFRSSPAWMAFFSDTTATTVSVEGLYPERIAFDARRRPAQGMPLDSRAEGVRVEVWRPVYDRDAIAIRWELIASETASVRTSSFFDS